MNFIRSNHSNKTVVRVVPNTTGLMLYQACREGNALKVQGLLLRHKDMDINYVNKDENGYTSLHLAAKNGHQNIVKMLIDAGADCSIWDNDFKTATKLAEEASAGTFGHRDAVRHLKTAAATKQMQIVDYHFAPPPVPVAKAVAVSETVPAVVIPVKSVSSDGAKPTSDEKSMLLNSCAKRRDVKKVTELLTKHKDEIDIDYQVAGDTALHHASKMGSEEIVQLLISYGADLNIVNKECKTALFEAAFIGRMKIVELLLSAGADPNIPNQQGKVLQDLVHKQRPGLDDLLAKYAHKTSTAPTEPALQTPDTVSNNTNRTISPVATATYHQPLLSDNDSHEKAINTPLSAGILDNIAFNAHQRTQLQEILSLQPQLQALVSTTYKNIRSLASASPQTIEYLRSLGDNGVIAEQQYAYIRSDPLLHEYYIAFNQAVSSAVLACQSIQSGMVADSRVAKGEQIMNYIDMAANASGFPGVSIATGICNYLIKLPNDALRTKSVSRVTTSFPGIDSHKFIEILSRELTILQQEEIRSVGTSEPMRRTLWEKTKRTVEWLQTLENATAVQSYASSHASTLLDKLMSTDPVSTIQLGDLDKLVLWSVGGRTAQSIGINTKLAQIRSGGGLDDAKLSTVSTTVRLVNSTTNGTSTTSIAATTNTATSSGGTSDSFVIETDSLKAKLAALEARELEREQRELQRDLHLTSLQEQHLQREAESEKQTKELNALKKDVNQLSSKDSVVSSGDGGQAQAMLPQPHLSTGNAYHKVGKKHKNEARIAHTQATVQDLVLDMQLLKESQISSVEKDVLIANLLARIEKLEKKNNKMW